MVVDCRKRNLVLEKCRASLSLPHGIAGKEIWANSSRRQNGEQVGQDILFVLSWDLRPVSGSICSIVISALRQTASTRVSASYDILHSFRSSGASQ